MTEYRVKGTWDEITTCELCGKQGLKSTVIVEIVGGEDESDGEIYVGSDCAAKLRTGSRNTKLAARIMREAKAADVRRAGAVEFSRGMMDFFGAATREGRGPAANFNRMVTQYVNANRGLWDMPREDCEKALLGSLAYHATVVETGGMSVFG
jgi:hypothetical protein